MSKKQCYVVTSGEYSDYRVEAVYLSKSLAKQHAKLARHTRVEPYPVRDSVPKQMSYLTWTFKKEGDFPSYYYSKLGTTYHQDAVYDPEFAYSQYCWPGEYDDVLVERDDDRMIRVEGFNHEKVRKVMGDRVARYKAEKAGVA